MFIIILILCLFVAVLIYGFFTIRKLNRQIEDFQAQADRIDDLSAKVNTITSKLDCLAIGNEDTQEKHFDVDSNSLMLMNGFNNRFLHRPNHDEITSDDNETDEKEQEQTEKQKEIEIKPEIKEDFKQENKETDEQPKIVEKNIQQDNKPVNDTKSNDSINFKKIIDLDNDDINKFDIEINDKEINNEIKEKDDEQELNKEINDEQDFFLESKEDVQQDVFNDKNDDIANENNNDQSDNIDDDNEPLSESNNETNNEISVDYTIIKKFIESHPLNKLRVPVLKQFILDNHIDDIDSSILTMKREDMYNRLKELIKDK